MTELPIERILLESISHIEQAAIPYAVMGGFAARAWGVPRPTFDADIAIAADAESLERLFQAFERSGFDVPQEHRTGFLDRIDRFRKAKVTRFEDQVVWSVDLFLVEGDFLKSALRRARPATVGGRSIRVMAPEDIVLLKLLAKRRKDLADIEEIMQITTVLDVDYLKKWAAVLGVESGLNEFLPEEH